MYPISVDHPGNRGILNKMEYQRAAFVELVGPVDLICSSVRGPIVNGEPSGEYRWTGRGLGSLNHYFAFYLHASKLAAQHHYDFIYVRYPLALPAFLWFLDRARRANPEVKVVVEIATFPYRQELQTPKQRVLRTLDDVGHGVLEKRVDAIVTFYGQTEIYGIPCIRSGNGVDVRALPLSRPGASERGAEIIAVGNLATRHGVDRALVGLAAHANTEPADRTTLHLVGDGPAVPELRSLATELGTEARVRFHGMQSGEPLDRLFDEADVALDSLGLHRLGLPSSSSLKAREYCARGVPFALASDDPDFPASLRFVHRVPADESPLDIGALLRFSRRMREAQPGVGAEMRDYAERNLTWEAKLAPVAAYLDQAGQGVTR